MNRGNLILLKLLEDLEIDLQIAEILAKEPLGASFYKSQDAKVKIDLSFAEEDNNSKTS